MIDLIRKLFDSEEDTDLIESIKSIENLTNGVVAKEVIQEEEKEFFEKLFEKVEEAKEQDKKLPCKIFFLNDNEIVVKVKGLFAHLPLRQMAWHYPHLIYWKSIFPTLAGQEFKCKITEAERREGERFHIVADASEHPFRKAELIENAEYTGIVLQKNEEDALIDIGSHFKWKYGSLRGFLPLTTLAEPETFHPCEPGDSIKIKYKGNDDRGLIFAPVDTIDLATEFIGKMVWVQIGKSENTAPYFMVKGKYRGDLPINKLLYPTKKKKLQKLRNEWVNGDIINCEVVDYKPKRGLILKWIDDEPEEIDWSSDEMIDYIGREVSVHVYRLSDGELRFLVENRYSATLSARNRSNKKNDLADGEIITARICSIDLNDECFKIRWLQKK